jgi:hypothetical protein
VEPEEEVETVLPDKVGQEVHQPELLLQELGTCKLDYRDSLAAPTGGGKGGNGGTSGNGAPTELYQEAVAVEPETEPMKSAATVLQDASS